MSQASLNIVEFEELVSSLDRFHNRIGLSIFDKKPKSSTTKTFGFILKLGFATHMILLLMASSTKFSTNNRFERFLSIIYFCVLTIMASLQFLFWRKRDEVLKILDWCHWIENYEPQTPGFQKPKDWFKPKRQFLCFLLKWVTLWSHPIVTLIPSD